MINLRSPREVALMKKAGATVGYVLNHIGEYIKPGVSTWEVDKICEEMIYSRGCKPNFKGYEGFPNASCISVNEVLVHGIPSKDIILRNGDIVTVDVGADYKGYQGDGAWTFTVGEVTDPKVLELMEVTKEALYLGIEQVKPGNRVGDISHAIQTYVEAHGFSLPVEYTGHGIGTDMHEDPAIPNVGRPHTLELLRKDMCICIEPMVFMGKPHCRTLSDGWTVVSRDRSWAAHYEHELHITAEGCEILTKEEEE